MKIVAFVGGQPNHLALVTKIHQRFGLSTVVVSANITKKKKRSFLDTFRLFINRVGARVSGAPLTRAWKELQRKYETHDVNRLGTEVLHVVNINSPEVFELITKLKPELVVVSGTNLVNKDLIDLCNLSGKIINLHTGISPYVKGGPNCTNWCLATGDFHLIGNTIMWLDPGIDSGQLITTERTRLNGSESLTELHFKVMEHAHDLYLRVIAEFFDGRKLPRVSQKEISEGVTFYTRDWKPSCMSRAIRNFSKKYSYSLKSNELDRAAKNIQLVQLNVVGESDKKS